MKRVITNYSFNAAGKTVSFTDGTAIQLQGLLLIANTTRNAIIYNFADPNAGGELAGNVLTLDYDTTSMQNTDLLLIYYEDASMVPALASDAMEGNAIATAIFEAVNALRFLESLRETNAALRVSIASSIGLTISTLPTLATLTTLNQMAGISLNAFPGAVTNMAAVQSNIHNVVVT